MISTWCDAFDAFHTVIAAIAATAMTATVCDVRLVGPRRRSNGRASRHSPASTMTPPMNAFVRRYQPSTARSSPTEPKAATAAAATNTKTRSHCGSSSVRNERTLLDPRAPKTLMQTFMQNEHRAARRDRPDRPRSLRARLPARPVHGVAPRRAGLVARADRAHPRRRRLLVGAHPRRVHGGDPRPRVVLV